jgi:hypothetical protein
VLKKDAKRGTDGASTCVKIGRLACVLRATACCASEPGRKDDITRATLIALLPLAVLTLTVFRGQQWARRVAALASLGRKR